jgi:signal transduction histidine kinase
MSRILVVDDDPDLRTALTEVLRMAGHDVAGACDGPSALRELAAHPFDVVLLDVMMPGMSGLEVLRALRADEAYDDMPIIMVTALSDVRDRVSGLEAGADDYLGKPFDASELLARVSAALRQRRLMVALADARHTATRLNRELVRNEEDLRAEVSADIHDTILQTLVALRLWLEEAADDPDVPAGSTARAEALLADVDQSIATGRKLIRGLRPTTIACGGLPQLIDTEVHALTDRSGIETDVRVPERLDGLSSEAETMLFRIVREAVVNALRHADADELDVVLEASDGHVVATVHDDGRGFDAASVSRRGVAGHFGIPGMLVRAESAGGTVDVSSAPGLGTTVTIDLPREEVLAP